MSEMPPTPTDLDRAALSRRQALAAGGGLAVALAAGSVATAGAAAAASGSSSDLSPQTLLSLSLAQAQAVVRGAEREARRLKLSVYIVVVDACGDVKASARQDGNSRASLDLAPPKAKTALAFRTATSTLAANATDPLRAQSFLAAGFSLLGGGVPIAAADGTVIGAVAVGGGSPEQDEQIALAGVAALS